MPCSACRKAWPCAAARPAGTHHPPPRRACFGKARGLRRHRLRAAGARAVERASCSNAAGGVYNSVYVPACFPACRALERRSCQQPMPAAHGMCLTKVWVSPSAQIMLDIEVDTRHACQSAGRGVGGGAAAAASTWRQGFAAAGIPRRAGSAAAPCPACLPPRWGSAAPPCSWRAPRSPVLACPAGWVPAACCSEGKQIGTLKNCGLESKAATPPPGHRRRRHTSRMRLPSPEGPRRLPSYPSLQHILQIDMCTVDCLMQFPQSTRLPALLPLLLPAPPPSAPVRSVPAPRHHRRRAGTSAPCPTGSWCPRCRGAGTPAARPGCGPQTGWHQPPAS